MLEEVWGLLHDRHMYRMTWNSRNTRATSKSTIISTANNSNDNRTPCGTHVHTHAKRAEGLVWARKPAETCVGGREGAHRGGKSNTRPSKASVRRGRASREAEDDKKDRARYPRDRARHRRGWAHRAGKGGSLTRPSKVSNGERWASSEAKKRQEGVGGASREAL